MASCLARFGSCIGHSQANVVRASLGGAVAALGQRRHLRSLKASRPGLEQTAMELSQRLRKEKKWEEENYDTPEDIATYLSQCPWKVDDKQGTRRLRLSCNMANEKIQVLVNLEPVKARHPNTVTYIAAEVVVSKKDSDKAGALVFTAAVGEGQINVPMFHFQPDPSVPLGKTAEAMFAHGHRYPGPAIQSLPEEVVESIKCYLEARRLDSSFATFLETLYYHKEHKEYVHWLKSVADFLEK
eukprot:comp12601_c0_seq1/m.7627 comp12601_c0_seq1/g.7627  ORF comp12601_c0_seq1/g.7627 comp12601_c0_seq1/m.7627 type:complete len:242 (-) comp12601_c0_seq1:134-859(-)